MSCSRNVRRVSWRSMGKGRGYPSLTRLTDLADPDVLKTFLTIRAAAHAGPVSRLLERDEVRMIAEYLKTSVLDKDGPTTGYVQPKSTRHAGMAGDLLGYDVATIINCHSIAEYPRQTDDRYPHVYHVLRGEEDKGVEMKRCTQCHGIRNNPETGAPGRLDWHMAPVRVTDRVQPGRRERRGSALHRFERRRARTESRDLAQLFDFDRNRPVHPVGVGSGHSGQWHTENHAAAGQPR